MEIVRPGYDTSSLMRCDVCHCEFRYLPCEIETEEHLLYNVPAEARDYNGGCYHACGVRYRAFVTCPCCKTKCYIDKEQYAMQIAIANEYLGLTERDHENALEWCKACIQKRIDEDHLQDQVDWNDLIVKDEKIDELGWYCMECRLPLKELF